jgi:excisionase family DNA binding protein
MAAECAIRALTSAPGSAPSAATAADKNTREEMRMPESPPSDRSLLTIDEAAAYLNVPAHWVSDAVRLRRVPCTRIGKHVRFRFEHLDELIAAGEEPVTTPT